MYSESGRIRRLSAYCSRMWAVQPAMREAAGAGVPGLVDAVAEAHDLLLAAEAFPDPAGGAVRGADLVEHVADLLDGAAVEGALQGGDRGGGGGVDVGQGRGCGPGGGGRG